MSIETLTVKGVVVVIISAGALGNAEYSNASASYYDEQAKVSFGYN